MDDYKPLTDEEIAPLQHALANHIDTPPSYFWPHVLEQARRANALAFSLLSGNPYHLSDEQRVLLHAYLGETND